MLAFFLLKETLRVNRKGASGSFHKWSEILVAQPGGGVGGENLHQRVVDKERLQEPPR